jgi:hypothetical protein
MRRQRWPGRLHRAADHLDQRFRPVIRSVPALETAWIAILDGIVSRQPDRAYLRRSVLPALARNRPARLLFVGVRGYTRGYDKLFRKAGTEFWTSDIDPAAAAYGARGRHVTADIRRIDEVFSAAFFPVVVMNGVFGWGVDDPAHMEQALVATERVIAPGGFLLLGWNSDRCDDPDTLAAISLFEPAAFDGLPHRKAFDDVTHVYAWYRVRRNPPGLHLTHEQPS